MQVERAAVEHAVQRDGRTLGAVNARRRVDGPDKAFHLGQFLRRDKVGLVQQHHIGKGDLVLGLAAVLQAQRQMLGVDEGDNGIETGFRPHIVIHEEGLCHGGRIGKAGGLHQDCVETARPAHQALDDAHEIAAHGAADAAVVHFVDFLVGFHDQVVVDTDLAELIDDDGIALAVILGEDAVQQRRLAGTEIAGEHGNGNGIGGFAHGFCLRSDRRPFGRDVFVAVI